MGAALAIAVVLGCSPAMPGNETFKGPGVTLKQTVSERGATLELIGADGRTRWKAKGDGFFRPLFSKDGKYVAEGSGVNMHTVEVYGPDGKHASYRPLELASKDEVSLMGHSTCGIEWYGGMRFEGQVLVVLLNQAPPRRPTEEEDPTPKLEISIDLVSGKLSRSSAPKMVKTEDLINTYRTQPDQQFEAAMGLVRKAQQQPGEKDPALLAFARAELPKTKDPRVQDLLLSLIIQKGSEPDFEWVAERALEAGWPAAPSLHVMGRLQLKKPDLGQKYAQALLERRLGDANSRAEAVRLLARNADGLKWIQKGLDDPERYVHDAAEQATRDLPAGDEAFAFLVANADRDGMRYALIERYINPQRFGGPPNPWLTRVETACDAAMQQKWPGCEAWSAAMADVRGDAAVAKTRYQHALAGITAELAKSKVWSGEVESFFRVHLRLAQLAKAAGQTAEVERHLKDMKASSWWQNARVDCTSGLPRALDAKCDGGTSGDALLARLRGKTPKR